MVWIGTVRQAWCVKAGRGLVWRGKFRQAGQGPAGLGVAGFGSFGRGRHGMVMQGPLSYGVARQANNERSVCIGLQIQIRITH